MIKSSSILSYLSGLICTTLIVGVGGINEKVKAADLKAVVHEVTNTDLKITWDWKNNEDSRLLPPESSIIPWAQLPPIPTIKALSNGTVRLGTLYYQHLKFKDTEHDHPKGKIVNLASTFLESGGKISQSFWKIREHGNHFDGYNIGFFGDSRTGGTITLIAKHGNTRVEVPEPLTILGSLTALGIGITLKKRQKQTL